MGIKEKFYLTKFLWGFRKQCVGFSFFTKKYKNPYFSQKKKG